MLKRDDSVTFKRQLLLGVEQIKDGTERSVFLKALLNALCGSVQIIKLKRIWNLAQKKKQECHPNQRNKQNKNNPYN